MTGPEPRPRRRWRRWLLRGLVGLLVLRLLLALFLPQVIAFAARFAGLDVAVRTASLSLSGLSLQADDVVVRQSGDPDARPLLAAHGLVADLSLAHLLVGDLVLVDAALTGGMFTVQRRADGTLRLPAGWQASAPPTAAKPATPLRFEAPLSIVSLRLHDIVLQYDDEAVPDRSWSARLDVEVAEFGRRDRPGVALLRVHQPAWFDTGWVRAEARLQATQLDVTWEAAVRGVRSTRLQLPEPAAQWLRGARVLDATLGGTLHAATGASNAPAEFSAVVRGNLHADESERLVLTAAVGPGPVQDAAASWPFTFELKAPGLVERVHVEDGHVSAANGGDVRGRCEVDGLSLHTLQPWLRAPGLSLPPQAIDLSCHLAAQGGSALRANLDDLEVRSGGELLAIGHAAVHGLQFDGGSLRIGRVELNHVAATLVRSAAGGIGSLGIELRPQPAAPPSATAAATLPQVRIDALAVGDVTTTFRDELARPPRIVTVRLADLTGSGLACGSDGPAGTFQAELHVPDAVGALRLSGTVQPGSRTLQTELQLTGDRITLAALRPWLAARGIEPVVRDGALTLLAGATVTMHDDGPEFSGHLANVRLRDGDDVLLSLRRVDGRGVRPAGPTASLGEWHLLEPFVLVQRRDERVQVAGLAFGQAPETNDAAAPPDGVRADGRRAPALGPCTIERAGLRLFDGDKAPLVVGFDLRVDAPDPRTATIPLRATVRADGIVQTATIDGTLETGTGLGFAATLQAAGLRGDGIARFLPAHLGCTLVDGSLQARVAGMVPAGSGGATELRIDDFVLRDRDAELAAVRRLHGAFVRPDADHIRITTLRAEGVRSLWAETEAGLHGPGFVVRQMPTTSPDAGATPPPTAGPGPQLPLVAIDDLAVELERVVFRDRRHGDGEPLVFAARCTAPPWQPSATGAPTPLQLRGELQLLPLVREFTFTASVDPYATKPTLAAQLRARGLDPSALPRVLPAVAGRLDGTTSAMSCTADLHATLDLGRRDGRSLPGDRPLAGQFALENVVFRDDRAGTELLRLGMVDVNARAVDLRTGLVLLRSVHVDDCTLAADTTADGFELLGVRLRPAASTTSPAAPAADPARRGPEFAIDRLHVTGLDLAYRDQTTTPPTVLPIVDGTLSVRGFTTAPDDHSPMLGFALHLHGGPVPLERRVVRSSLFAGVLGAAVDAVGGAADRHELEPRPLLDELEVTGELRQRLPWRGRVQASVAGFELAALRGLAKSAGVDITDGLLDQTVRLDLHGHGGLDVATRPVFTWLSLTEPPGGPISTYLRLPAPLDSVLFLLRNDDDEHRLPLNLHFPAAGLSPATLREAIAEAMVRLISAAVASSPTRAASVFTGALGLHGNRDLPAPHVFGFAPVDPLPAPYDMATIAAQLRADPTLELLLVHELGVADLERTARLVSPPTAVIEAEVQRLRARQRELQAALLPLRETTAALYSAGRLHEARTQQRLLASRTAELGELGQTLAEMLAMLVGDTARAANRRSQEAAAELAASRLLAVRTQLQLVDPTLPTARIRTKTPRGVPTADLPEGGRVVATLRRRKGQ
ncbi:MAG: DUF748 domain-containing protein [Planctomycetes bacterium]|nr:DUF748 domain-containing protein [Planctomycetota bacterium]